MPRPGPRATTDNYWNHNTHFHDVVLRSVPRGCGEALDVGCGDGLLARRLASRAAHVTGIDRSPEMIERARTLSAKHGNVEFMEADALACDLPAEGHDFVCSVTAIHHMDFTAALTAMRETLRPGGSLVVISLANSGTLGDRVYSLTCIPVHHYHRFRNRRRAGDPGAPIAWPDMTWSEVREEAARLLPGARFRRHRLWRYSIVWRKPR
ncbi:MULTISPECIES: class I SAM-dependent methyltransferase [Thermomonosporaceae]|uniref:class I SAM-dependent methyltransferase n=1 Tax=Thermomonosporaceae TaxID=2012 RepID=UPI00255ACF52|nr:MULTISPECIES: class I SAM-dependent methyltransferase [Thermomonosporaceae]MDL4770627.1 class I SAM-dependent methyltransferase [Actinomadura xylanilytica]